jgi:hypothetical protein
MAISVRGVLTFATAGATASSVAIPYTGWTGANPQAGDLILVVGPVRSGGTTVTQSAGTGSYTIVQSNLGSNFSSYLAYRVYQSGDTAPTFNWVALIEYTAFACAWTPDTGNTISLDQRASPAPINPGTSITPSSVTATGAGEVFTLLWAAQAFNTGAGALSPTLPTTPAGLTAYAAASTYAGGGSKHANSAGGGYLGGQSGTVTPSALTFANSTYASAFSVLIAQSAATPAGLLPQQLAGRGPQRTVIPLTTGTIYR